MASASPYQELVEYIAKSLVDDPAMVDVHESEDRSGILLELSVAEADMGRIIGRGGTLINSMRSLLQVLAGRHGKRVSLELLS
ncbi:MAG: KH domain-containing protein [Candidatus Promineifilaceae bacterium]